MSIENPRTNTNVNVNNRGDHVPSEQNAPETPRWPGPESDVDFPRPRDSLDQSYSPETYVLPPQETEQKPETEPTDEKPGFFKRTSVKVALGVSGLVATGVAVFIPASQHGESDIPKQALPVATAESQPSSTASSTAAPSSTEKAPSTAASAPAAESWSPRNPNLDRRNKSTLIIEEKAYTLEQAKQELFTVTQAEAPTPEMALTQYINALQKGMNINSRGETELSRGGVEATQAESEEIIESGLLSKLGKNHNRVDKAATDEHVLPSTAVWETNMKNIKMGTETRAKIEGANIQTNAPGNYTVRGNLVVTGYIEANPKYTNTYGVQIGMKLENGVWNFSNDTYFMRVD